MAEVLSQTNAVNKDDIIILVMGEVGSGKSRFINSVAGRQLAPESDRLASEDIMEGFRVQQDGMRYFLVESPGFNQLIRHDGSVLGQIIQWLNDNCLPHSKIGGIIYLHDISQDKNAQQYVRPRFWPLALLRKPEPASHLVIVTAKWDREGDQKQFTMRENQLRTGVWMDIIQKGARIERFQSPNSAKGIITSLTRGNLQPLQLTVLLNDLQRIHKRHEKSTAQPSSNGFFDHFARLFGFRKKMS